MESFVLALRGIFNSTQLNMWEIISLYAEMGDVCPPFLDFATCSCFALENGGHLFSQY